jgi:predicted secreted acid phosphatase
VAQVNPTHALVKGHIDHIVRFADPERAVEWATRAVNTFIKHNRLRKHQIGFVFDIDDTLIHDAASTHPMPRREAAALERLIQELFNHCKRFGKVFLVTARLASPDVMEFTRNELHAGGIRGWTDALFCPRQMRRTFEGVAAFKRQARDHIQRKHGLKVVLTVGDRWADHVDHAELDVGNNELADVSSSRHLFVMTVSNTHHATAIALKLPASE